MHNLKDEPLGEIELEAMRDYNIQHQIEFLYENDSSES